MTFGIWFFWLSLSVHLRWCLVSSQSGYTWYGATSAQSQGLSHFLSGIQGGYFQFWAFFGHGRHVLDVGYDALHSVGNCFAGVADTCSELIQYTRASQYRLESPKT